VREGTGGHFMGIISNIRDAFKPPDPKELVRKWQREVRAEQRKVERDIREVEVEQKKMQANIRDAAKRWDARLAQDVADRASRAPQLRPLARAGTTWDH